MKEKINGFKDCFRIIDIIMNFLIYGTGKDRLQIIKDMIDDQSWLYK